MAHTNDEIDELNSLKHAASERRSKRASFASKKGAASKEKAASNKRATPTPPAGTEEEDGDQSPPPVSESEELVAKLTGQVETIFSEIDDASRERPVLALVSAFAVGVLIGHIFSKKQG